MASSATRPNFYQDFSTGIEQVAEEKVIEEDVQALAHITHYKGWKLLLEYKDRLEKYLDTLVSEAIAGGSSMADIGERTMVREMAKLVLDRFVEKAEHARREAEK